MTKPICWPRDTQKGQRHMQRKVHETQDLKYTLN